MAECFIASNEPQMSTEVSTAISMEITTFYEIHTEAKKRSAIEYKIANIIYHYCPPILIIIALFGNSMTMLVFSRKTMRQSVTSFLFRVLAVADTFFVLVSMVPEALNELGHNPITYSTDLRCKIYTYVYLGGRTSAIWILVLIVMERFIGINFPHKAASIITHKRAKIAVAMVFILTYLLYLMVPFITSTWTLRNMEGEIINYFCIIEGYKLKYFDKGFTPYDISWYAVMPFIIMVLANTSIIYCLIKAKRRRSQTASNSNNSTDIGGMTAMLLGISFAFLACAIPYFVAGLGTKASEYGKPGVYLLTAVSSVLVNLNHCINFYIYCLTGSHLRSEVRNMFCCQ